MIHVFLAFNWLRVVWGRGLFLHCSCVSKINQSVWHLGGPTKCQWYSCTVRILYTSSVFLPLSVIHRSNLFSWYWWPRICKLQKFSLKKVKGRKKCWALTVRLCQGLSNIYFIFKFLQQPWQGGIIIPVSKWGKINA